VPGQPPPDVLAAFGVAGARPVPLGGGQGTSWVAGDVVLKPAELDHDELAWQAQVLGQIPRVGFRLARPRLAVGGSLCVDGWCATEYLSGQHEPRRWAEIIAVGQRFHAALRGIPRPSFLDRRSNRWAISDRVAWGELPATDFPHVRHLPQLTSALGIYLMYSFFQSFPRELEEAGRIDGCNRLQVYWKIVLPLARPALAALGIITFIYAWNDLFWPLIAITSSRTYTVQVGLTTFQGEHITHWSQVMAGTVLTTVPVLLVFLIGQRRFVQAITGAVKG